MREHIRRVARLTLIILANLALLVALLVVIEGLSGYAFFLNDLVPRLRESNLTHTQYDAEIGWVGLPNVDIEDMYGPGADLRTNEKGFRNAETFATKRDSDMRRIVCSGDSVTFGEYVGNDQTFCSMLTELDPKLETINMGQVGYGVDQAYLWYRRDADDLEVDVHVFAFITHDFMRMQYEKFMGIPRPKVILEDAKLVVANVPISESTYAMPVWLAETLNSADGLRTVKLATKVRKRLNLAPAKVPGAWDARGAEEVKTVVARLFEELRDYDSARSRETVLVYFPSAEELQQPNSELAYWMSVVESNARRLDIPFINFVSLFADLPAADVTRLFVDGYHFSEWGNALVARELLKHLRDEPRTTGRQTSDGQLAAVRAGTPYQHVAPADVGVTIGLGVTAAVPSAACSFANPITADGTTVENCVYDGPCIFVKADDVTFRNVDVRRNNGNGCFHGFWVENANNFTFTNSRIDGDQDKVFYLEKFVTNLTIEKSEITGFQDTVFCSGDSSAGGPGPANGCGDILIEDNYIHDLDGFSFTSDPHFDVLQQGGWGPNGYWVIRGNYFKPNIAHKLNKLNAIYFGGDGRERVLIENNYMYAWGLYGPRWYGPGANWVVRYNVYDVKHKTLMPRGNGVSHAVYYESPDSNGTYRCNRYSDGDFIEQRYVNDSGGSGSLKHDTSNCPSYP